MELQVVDGETARALDPRGVEWPAESIAVVARDAGETQGISVLIPLLHIEGTWVSEKKRGSFVLVRLIERVEEIVRSAGRSHVFAFADERQPEVAGYLERLGYVRMPFHVYSKELVECQ